MNYTEQRKHQLLKARLEIAKNETEYKIKEASEIAKSLIASNARAIKYGCKVKNA